MVVVEVKHIHYTHTCMNHTCPPTSTPTHTYVYTAQTDSVEGEDWDAQ